MTEFVPFSVGDKVKLVNVNSEGHPLDGNLLCRGLREGCVGTVISLTISGTLAVVDWGEGVQGHNDGGNSKNYNCWVVEVAYLNMVQKAGITALPKDTLKPPYYSVPAIGTLVRVIRCDKYDIKAGVRVGMTGIVKGCFDPMLEPMDRMIGVRFNSKIKGTNLRPHIKGIKSKNCRFLEIDQLEVYINPVKPVSKREANHGR